MKYFQIIMKYFQIIMKYFQITMKYFQLKIIFLRLTWHWHYSCQSSIPTLPSHETCWRESWCSTRGDLCLCRNIRCTPPEQPRGRTYTAPLSSSSCSRGTWKERSTALLPWEPAGPLQFRDHVRDSQYVADASSLVGSILGKNLLDRFFLCMEANYSYAIKKKARNALSCVFMT